MRQCKAEPSLEGHAFGRELYAAGTAEAVSLSNTSAASSVTGSSAAASMNQVTLASVADSKAAVMSRASSEGAGKLGQVYSTEAGQEWPQDIAAVHQVCVYILFQGRLRMQSVLRGTWHKPSRSLACFTADFDSDACMHGF